MLPELQGNPGHKLNLPVRPEAGCPVKRRKRGVGGRRSQPQPQVMKLSHLGILGVSTVLVGSSDFHPLHVTAQKLIPKSLQTTKNRAFADMENGYDFDGFTPTRLLCWVLSFLYLAV